MEFAYILAFISIKLMLLYYSIDSGYGREVWSFSISLSLYRMLYYLSKCLFFDDYVLCSLGLCILSLLATSDLSRVVFSPKVD